MTATVLPPPPPSGGPRPRRRAGLALVTAIGLLIALATTAWTAFAAITVSARQEASESASYDVSRASPSTRTMRTWLSGRAPVTPPGWNKRCSGRSDGPR